MSNLDGIETLTPLCRHLRELQRDGGHKGSRLCKDKLEWLEVKIRLRKSSGQEKDRIIMVRIKEDREGLVTTVKIKEDKK